MNAITAVMIPGIIIAIVMSMTGLPGLKGGEGRGKELRFCVSVIHLCHMSIGKSIKLDSIDILQRFEVMNKSGNAFQIPW